MNRVVWVYRDYRENSRYSNKVSHDFELLCPEEIEVLKVSLASWMTFAPDYRRIIYLDEKVKQYLQKYGLLRWYDEVLVVDFEKEIDSKYVFIDFFAAPKLWAISQQQEPFILADTEMVLRNYLSNWFNSNQYYCIRYPKDQPMCFLNWSRESRQKFFKLRGLVAENYRKFLNPQNMINAGFTSWPDIEVSKKVGRIALDICNEVCRIDLDFPEKWTFCEESILPNLVEYYGHTTIQSIEFTKVDDSCSLLEYSSLGILPKLYEGFLFDIKKLREQRPEFNQMYLKVFENSGKL